MKILWTVNILFPEAKALLERRPAALVSSGGWLIGAAEALAAVDGVELHIACPADVPGLIRLKGEKIHYHLYPGLQRSGEPFWGERPQLDAVFKEIIGKVTPDLIDIHGTEYAHSLSCFRVANHIPHIVTIQGFVYSVAQHYRDGLSRWAIFAHKRPFHHGILHEQAVFARRGAIEKKWLSQVRCFIGRTEWDREQVLSLNPQADYFTCNETLRNAFYEGKWEWRQCEKHSIFLSQGGYPLKGLHQVLRALPDVLEKYPDTRLYIGGGDLLGGKKKHRSNYARLIASLIESLHLEDKVIFTGVLDAQAMKERLMRTHVFICPSSIENSPNSLAEAQMLGVPCIAARVGGIPSMIPDASCGRLYDYPDIGQLTRHICEVFAQGPTPGNGPMQEMARLRHDPERNVQTLLSIYQDVMEKQHKPENKYLVVSLDVANTAPGIVFKLLIKSLAESSRITLLAQDVDRDFLPGSIRLIPLYKGVQNWERASKKWDRYGWNPRDERWARKTFRKNKKAILQERYDALIVLTSNGYYSALNLGQMLKNELRCPYIIYSVDGMPSPISWLGGDVHLHQQISAGLRLLCADADLFLLSNPNMMAYQQQVIPNRKGEWDYLFTPYKPLSPDFSLQKHEGFNILYAGSLYGLRKIDGLIDAFRLFLTERQDARLMFVGNVQEEYKSYGTDLVKEGKLIFKAPTEQIDDYYARADCLIDIAADIPDDVFLSSKVICYLPYPIPIIAISGAGSPVSQIMGGVPSILQTGNRANEILSALRQSQHIHDFSERDHLLSTFHPERLCNQFRTFIEAQLKKEQLIVTLTTWKARIGNIPTVLDSIFKQTMPPDLVVLNLAYEEEIPEEVQAYIDSHKVEVNRVPDTKVYKKLIPTLKKHPEACVVAIDDDWIYPPGMLEEFMSIHRRNPDQPISGNRVSGFHLSFHCGCASLTMRRFFGKYLDWIDDEVIRNCPCDDIVYTYFTRKNGYTYTHTDNLYYENMTPYRQTEAYSSPDDGTPIAISWDYLTRRFGLPQHNAVQRTLYRFSHWLFELDRDKRTWQKYLRICGFTFHLADKMRRQRILVVWHIYYKDQIPWFLERLSQIHACDWDLLVTGTILGEKEKQQIRLLKANARFLSTENVGYDIWPFISAIQQTDLGDYDWILKLHTKSPVEKGTSIRFAHRNYREYEWRDALVNPFLRDKRHWYKILKRLQRNPRCGMLCSKEFYIRSRRWPEDGALLDEELERLHISTQERRFCAGTMFLIRADLLSPVLKRHLSPENFPSESVSHGGGTLAHIYERIFSLLPPAQGYKVLLVGKRIFF